MPQPFLLLPLEEVSTANGWLCCQPFPVIAYGNGSTANADVLVADAAAAGPLLETINNAPLAALTLVQVLRATEKLPACEALTLESFAYATLQAGPEFAGWLRARGNAPRLIAGGEGPPILMEREGGVVAAQLNRPRNRNAFTVEMRDALVEIFDLMLNDDSIELLRLSATGSCFSIGGELREFGLAPSAAEAHFVRTVQNPARLLTRCAERVSCHVHKACIGSGIELPAFAQHLSAARRTFFQLPELQFGLIPGAGGCVSLPRRIGRQRTAWLALSGQKINAGTALDWGLIDEITNDGDQSALE